MLNLAFQALSCKGPSPLPTSSAQSATDAGEAGHQLQLQHLRVCMTCSQARNYLRVRKTFITIDAESVENSLSEMFITGSAIVKTGLKNLIIHQYNTKDYGWGGSARQVCNYSMIRWTQSTSSTDRLTQNTWTSSQLKCSVVKRF